MRITPLSAPLGAIVHALDATRRIPSETAGALRKALDQHRLLLLKGSSVSPSELVAFASTFGTPAAHGIVAGLAGYAFITEIRKEPDHGHNYGGTWHTDLSHQASPPLATVLQAWELPTIGGDTLWSDQYRAYEGLPPELRKRVDTLSAEHSAQLAFGDLAHDAASSIHPLAPVHPRTACRHLYVNPVSIVRLFDENGDEVHDGEALLADLLAHATQAKYQYRHRWSEGDLLVWDNRSTLHMAINDYPGQRRVMRRVAVTASTGLPDEMSDRQP